MKKYTKGKWIINIHPTETSYTLDLEAMGIDGITSEENSSNAKLIELAPDLLEALITMCEYHEKMATWDKGNNGYYKAKSLINQLTK